MSKSTEDHLYLIKIAKQVDAVPFLGDLYNSEDEEFFPLEKKKLHVKSLNVSADKFVGEVILADIDWSAAPKDYDKIVVGVEVTVPRKGKKPLSGSWILTGSDEKARGSYEFNVDVSPGDIRVTNFYFIPLKNIKPTTEINVPYEFSFHQALADVTDFINRVRSRNEDIMACSDNENLQNLLDNNKELNNIVQDWIGNLTCDNWARFTHFLINQSDLVEDYIKYANSEIIRIEEAYKEKQCVVDGLKNESIEYVKSKEQWLDIVSHNPEVYALMFYYKLLQTNRPAKVVTLFRDYKNKSDRKNIVFCAVDLDVVDHSVFETPPSNLIKIQRYVRGNCETPDFLSTQRTTYRNVASPDGEIWQKRVVPKKRTLLKAVCPGHYNVLSCQAVLREWLCRQCELPLYYAFEDGICCDHCGTGATKDFLFCCDSFDHGDSIPLTAEQICGLNELQPMTEMNILLLGQLDVGKSTWINATCNYMWFKTLENAEMFEVKAPIPCKFVIGENETHQISVHVGDNENGREKLYEYATKDCRSYSVILDDRVINLIDTPALEDYWDIDEHKMNLKKVLDFVRHIDVLHGICLIMKHNEVPAEFDNLVYCLKELLSILNQTASRNLIFCFTNAGQTVYQPGEDLPILKYLLQEIGVNSELKDRTFCVDNEAFRYLCCRTVKDFQYSEEDRRNFSESWKKSAEETTRLLERVSTLNPHRTNDPLSLNHARRIILSLIRPIVDITQVVEANLNELRAKQAEVEGPRMTVDQIRRNAAISVYRMKSTELPHPRIVCFDEKCIEKVPLGKRGETKVHYRQLCQLHSDLPGIPAKVATHPCVRDRLSVRDTRLCQQCSCNWDTHMQICYEQTVVEEEEGGIVIDRLNEAKTAAEAKNVVVDHCIKRMVENESEKKEILTIASYFANFLRENRIHYYDDSIGDYLDYFLAIENKKQSKTPYDLAKIERMKATKRFYDQEVKTVQEVSEQRNIKMTADEIKSYEQKLYNLPIYGEQLKEAMDLALKSEDAAARNNSKVVIFEAKPNKITTEINRKPSESHQFIIYPEGRPIVLKR